MNNIRLLTFFGRFCSGWGLGMIINLLTQIPFDPLKPAYLSMFALIIMVLGFGIFTFLRASKLRKLQKVIEKDEMSIKIGYRTWALSAQIMTTLLLVISVVDSFSPFLNKISTEDFLTLILVGFAIIIGGGSLYYSKHPDKTGL